MRTDNDDWDLFQSCYLLVCCEPDVRLLRLPPGCLVPREVSPGLPGLAASSAGTCRSARLNLITNPALHKSTLFSPATDRGKHLPGKYSTPSSHQFHWKVMDQNRVLMFKKKGWSPAQHRQNNDDDNTLTASPMIQSAHSLNRGRLLICGGLVRLAKP